jgi:two-component system chemotaxis response regulator CheY
MNRSVLVVDDDPFIVDALAELLRDEGCKVNVASNGLQALASLRELCVDVILLDLMMPIMDGWEFSRERRRLELCPTARLVVLTAAADPAAKAAQAGADAFLPKPYSADQLLRSIDF